MSITFRKAERADLDAVCRIYDHIHTGEEQGYTTTGWKRGIYPVRATAEAALTRGDLFVEELDGAVVGAGILNQIQVDVYAGAPWSHDAPDNEVMVLHTLVADPQAGAHGLGTAFVAYYEQYAAAHGCRYLRIDTNERNARARALYRGLGYREIGAAPCTFNGLEDIRLMLLEKTLPAARLSVRELMPDEAPRLRNCLEALAAHHNAVSVHFKGSYPGRPIDAAITACAEGLARGTSRAAVVEENGAVVGFCKLDLHDDGTGKLGYLVVLPQCRGKGYGGALMDWAMTAFAACGVRRIEVKVVDGNDAVRLYEKYGFRMNAHILVRGE